MNRNRNDVRRNRSGPSPRSPVVWPIRLLAALFGLAVLYAGNVLRTLLALSAPDLSVMPVTGPASFTIWSLPAVVVTGLLLSVRLWFAARDRRALRLATVPVKTASERSPASRRNPAGRSR